MPNNNPKKKKVNPFISAISKEKGVPVDSLMELADVIAAHESLNNPSAVQVGGGPGRGLYQFEIGKSGGAETALKRYKRLANTYGVDLHPELKDLDLDFDPSTLSKEAQDNLFFAYHRGHPTSDLTMYDGTVDTAAKFWGDYHNAGLNGPDDPRLNKFKKDYSRAMKNKKYNFGGDLLSNIKLGVDTFNMLKSIDDSGAAKVKQFNITPATNSTPYFNNGGDLEVPKFKQYNTGDHSTGQDSAINNEGAVSAINSIGKVQNDENMFDKYIFSDELKNPKTGNYFNIDAKNLVKKYKNSKLYKDEMEGLNFEMERLKGENEKAKLLAEGVQKENLMMKEFNFGGDTSSSMFNFESTDPLKPIPTLQPKPIDFSSSVPELSKSEVPLTSEYDAARKSETSANFEDLLNPAMLGKGIEMLGKSLIGVGGYDKVNPKYNKYESEIVQNINDRKIDLTSVFNDIRANQNKSIIEANNSSPSAATSNALKASALAATQKAIADASLKAQEINNQYQAQGDSVKASLGTQRAQAEVLAEDLEARNKGAYNNYLQGLLGDTGRYGAFKTNVAMQELANNAGFKYLQEIAPNFKLSANNMEEFINIVSSGDDTKLVEFINSNGGNVTKKDIEKAKNK